VAKSLPFLMYSLNSHRLTDYAFMELFNIPFQSVNLWLKNYIFLICQSAAKTYIFRIHAKINGATIVASDSTINLGVWISNLPQVIFSFGTAPE
jgi:hypothetical protein